MANFQFWAEGKKVTSQAEPSWKSFSSGSNQLGSNSSLLSAYCLPCIFWFKLVYGQFKKSNMQRTFNFCPRPARKGPNVPQLKAQFLNIYTVYSGYLILMNKPLDKWWHFVLVIKNVSVKLWSLLYFYLVRIKPLFNK